VPLQYVLIGRSHGGSWAAAERGALAAEQQLGLPRGGVLYYAPEQDEPAAQILAVERFTAQKVRGIALAPSDARALEASIQRARDAGIWLTTFDSDAPASARLFFVGAPPRTGLDARDLGCARGGARWAWRDRATGRHSGNPAAWVSR